MKSLFLALIICTLFCVPTFSQDSRQLDVFGNVNCEEYLLRMDMTINEARNNPSSAVYVLIYEGKVMKYNSRRDKSELVFPTYGSANAKIRSMKKYLTLRKIFAEKSVFIKAGFREESGVEIWLVAAGAMPPKPTPTLTKMKYRKGKAVGFCLDCCEG